MRWSIQKLHTSITKWIILLVMAIKPNINVKATEIENIIADVANVLNKT